MTLWSMGVAAEANMPADGQKRPLDKNGSRGKEPVSKRAKAQSVSEEKRHCWLIVNINYNKSMRISILDSKLRYGQRLWLVGSTLTWTLPQDMLRSAEKRTKKLLRMEM